MKLRKMFLVDQSHTVIKGIRGDLVGVLLTVEKQLASVADPAISWRTETAETGLIRALKGKRRDALLITHSTLREYTVVICSQSYGRVLQASWMVLVAPRFAKDIRRAMRLNADPGTRFEVGSELDCFDVMDLKGFLAITRLALRDALRELTDDKDALLQDLEGVQLQ